MNCNCLVLFSCLLAVNTARAQDAIFEDNFSTLHIARPGWTSVYTHLAPDTMSISVQPVTGGPVPFAATFELKKDAPASTLGQASYIRSGPIAIPGKSFSIEWYENIVDGFGGPVFELWDNVGAQPNDRSGKCLEINRGPMYLTLQKKGIADVQPGWRHFKIAVDTTTNTCDVFYEDMDKPAASGAAIDGHPNTWDHIGIGFCLYISPGTHPTQWQLGGIKIAETKAPPQQP